MSEHYFDGPTGGMPGVPSALPDLHHSGILQIVAILRPADNAFCTSPVPDFKCSFFHQGFIRHIEMGEALLLVHSPNRASEMTPLDLH